MISMSMSGDDKVHGKVRKFAKYAQDDAAKITNQYADILVQTVKQHASGRPGPQVQTGAYVGSITKFVEDQYTAGATTNAAQANRLENGFVGTDALGRHYNQPAFPHWRPSMDIVGPQYQNAMRQAVRRWWL